MAAESSDESELALIELERARIGHEIHDTLLPLVFAASASLQGLLEQEFTPGKSSSQATNTDQLPRERLGQIAGWLSEALQVGRKLLIQVYPPELEQQHWDLAVRDTLSRITDSDLVLVWDIDPDVNHQPVKPLSAAYRIVIEAVRNAIRHGKATKIEVTARQESGGWSITVTDNGMGFDVTDVSTDRFGIRGMRARAKLAGGSCSVVSQPGRPTSVRFHWAA